MFDSLRAALSGGDHDFTSGSLHRGILLLAVPMMLEMGMESVFAVVDIWFVAGQGADAVAAVGLTESVLTLLYALAIGLSLGTTATVARRIGEGRAEAASDATVQAIVLGVALSLLIAIPGIVFAPDILALMQAEPATIEEGTSYTRIMLGTNVVIMLLFVINAAFRGAGDPMLAMRSLWLANGINIVLDPCLIEGLGPFPELGVTGAAVATTIGRGTGVAYQLWSLRRGSGRLRLAHARPRVDLPTMRRLLRVSAGGIAQMLIATASWVALMRFVAAFGTVPVAGYTIGVRILIFTFLPAWGLSNAAATLVGQNLGAGRPERAARAAWLTGVYNMAFLALVTVAFLTVGPWLVSLFTDEADVARWAAESLRIISYGYVFYAWGLVMTQALNGAGDTSTPTVLNLICFWLVQIPVAWALSHPLGLGPTGVFWSAAGSESLLAVLSVIWFARGHWKTRTV